MEWIGVSEDVFTTGVVPIITIDPTLVIRWPWISVKDKLPTPNTRVLCWDNQSIKIAEMPQEEEFNEHWTQVMTEWDEIHKVVTGAVTHWMPLPASPEE